MKIFFNAWISQGQLIVWLRRAMISGWEQINYRAYPLIFLCNKFCLSLQILHKVPKAEHKIIQQTVQHEWKSKSECRTKTNGKMCEEIFGSSLSVGVGIFSSTLTMNFPSDFSIINRSEFAHNHRRDFPTQKPSQAQLVSRNSVIKRQRVNFATFFIFPLFSHVCTLIKDDSEIF